MSTSNILSIREQAGALAEAIVERLYDLQPEIWKPYGSPGRAKSVRDARYHLEYLFEAVEANEPQLFTAYLAWVKTLFAGLNFPDTVLPSTLECTRLVLEEKLPEDQRLPALKILDEGRNSLDEMPSALASLIVGNAPSDDLARRYLDALLSGDRLSASRMILNAVDNGLPIKEIYLQVFQRAQREIGRLWQVNRVSVAQEHYCTAATQLIMSQLYPRIFAGEKKGRALVATCVGGELHELGARMVADFFELDGWDTHYLGANTPTPGILGMVAERRAQALAISTTMTFHLDQTRSVIAEARRSGLDVKIIVGGYPFNLAPQLWKKIGADGYAADAQQAVAVVERLTS